jgi:hypothetical protein
MDVPIATAKAQPSLHRGHDLQIRNTPATSGAGQTRRRGETRRCLFGRGRDLRRFRSPWRHPVRSLRLAMETDGGAAPKSGTSGSQMWLS